MYLSEGATKKTKQRYTKLVKHYKNVDICINIRKITKLKKLDCTIKKKDAASPLLFNIRGEKLLARLFNDT